MDQWQAYRALRVCCLLTTPGALSVLANPHSDNTQFTQIIHSTISSAHDPSLQLLRTNISPQASGIATEWRRKRISGLAADVAGRSLQLRQSADRSRARAGAGRRFSRHLRHSQKSHETGSLFYTLVLKTGYKIVFCILN
jgi:hypothetical protein